jgi:hypothetical protein
MPRTTNSALPMSAFAYSNYMPCEECGASLAAAERDAHVCDPERRLDYLMFQLRQEVGSFDDGLRGYLDSPQGRFAQWLAERERRRR